MTRLLVAAGCQGEGDHVQRWDTEPPTNEQTIVWLRSVPHAHQTPNLVRMVRGLHANAYEVSAVVMTRDWFSTAASQVRMGHVEDRNEADEHIRAAYIWIFSQLSRVGVPFYVISYEALCARPSEIMAHLCAALGLNWEDATITETITDGNSKYYAQA